MTEQATGRIDFNNDPYGTSAAQDGSHLFTMVWNADISRESRAAITQRLNAHGDMLAALKATRYLALDSPGLLAQIDTAIGKAESDEGTGIAYDDLPTINITNGLSAEDHVRKVRDGE